MNSLIVLFSGAAQFCKNLIFLSKKNLMEKRIQAPAPLEITPPVIYPEIGISHDPDEPFVLPAEEESDLITEEDPFDALPYEEAPEGEGP